METVGGPVENICSWLSLLCAQVEFFADLRQGFGISPGVIQGTVSVLRVSKVFEAFSHIVHAALVKRSQVRG